MNMFFIVFALFTPFAHAADDAKPAAAPAAAPTSAPTKTRLDAGTIEQLVKKEIPKIHDCYGKNLQGSKAKPTGNVSVKMVIGGDGKVIRTEIVSSQLKNEKVEACLQNTLKAIPFPVTGGTIEVDYPFLFK